ncbi:MAG TPA: plastocyanin/azurin family copper-binding protein [Solirubrobacterales bacterium]|nr:plastocyanin/azurin family copper-binding protein [Solirubrobacterales bacterium]
MTTARAWRGSWGAAALIAVALLGFAALRGDSASGATASGAKGVDISHFAFHPPTLRIKKGGRVAFTNSSRVTHTASGGGFDTKRIRPGTTKVVRFGRKGTFAYHCRIHPFMKGKIVVE